MISPHTAPGTKIVCVNDCPGAFNPPVAPSGYVLNYIGSLDGLRAGEVYTVRGFAIDPDFGDVNVLLQEIHRGVEATGEEAGFDLARFRYANLPSCLTELLTTVNLPREELV